VNANIKVLDVHRSGGDIIFNVFGQNRQTEFIAPAKLPAALGQHRKLFPFRRALKKRACTLTAGERQAGRERRHHLVGMTAHDGVAGSDTQVVEGGLVAVRTGP